MKNLKGFSEYIRTKCLKAYATEYLRIVLSLDIPLVKLLIERNLYPDLNGEKGIELIMISQGKFLTSLEDGTCYENARKSLKDWQEGKIALPGFARNDINPTDLVLIYAAQRQALLTFLSSFCSNTEEAVTVISELENYYMTVQKDAVQVLFNIQKETEQQLKESEETFRLVVQGVKDYAIFLLDVNGNIKSWNEGIERIKGYKADEIIGKHFSIFYTEEDKKRGTPQHELEMAEKLGHFEVEGYRIRKDGTQFWANAIYTPLYDDSGKLKGFSKITRDITAKRKVEEEKQRLITILEATSDFVGFANAKDRHIVYVNPTGRKMVGLDANDNITRFKINDVHPEWANKLLGEVAMPSAIKNGMWTGECAFRNINNGTEIPVSMVLLSHKAPDGSIEYFSTISRDITENKKAQDKLKQLSEELLRSNKELEQFAYVASHDLQEPLRTISSYVQLLANRYDDKLDKDAREFIAYAVDGSNRMRQLINSLLDYSRVNRVKPFEKINLPYTLNEILSDLEDQIRACGAVFKLGDLPDIYGDEVLMGQLFQNLITNALKFRSDKRPEIIISGKKRNGEYLFSVKDNGIGIEKEYWEKIFIIFQRLNNREEYPGTGIGLSICKKIVERHGGKMWVESEPGKGSCFYFTIKNSQEKQPDRKVRANAKKSEHTVN